MLVSALPTESDVRTAGDGDAPAEALLREVQRLAGENATLTGERDHYRQLAELLKRELDRLNDLQKTPREHVDLDQVQLAFEQIAKELLAKLASEPSQPIDGANEGAGSDHAEGTKPKKKRDSHGRNALPEHLPVQTIVFTPAAIATDAEVIDYEVSWRLGFRRGGFHRLKIMRPVYSVARSCAVDVSVVSATLHDGELLRVPPAPSAATDSVTTLVETPDAEGRARGASVIPPVVGSDVDARGEGRREGEPDSIAAPTSPAADAPSPRQVVEVVEVVEAPEAGSGDVDAREEEELRPSGSDATTKLICAELPEEMIPRGLPTSDLLAHLITQKFADKNPFNRQEGIYAREGVHLPRGNMCRWAELAHPSCKRVVDAMCAEALATAPYICTDATGILVQANDRCKRGHFWVFVAGREHVFFRYSKTHTSKEPLAFFKGYGGTVVADASNVYDALFRDPEGPDEGGCNAHARRYFYKALGSDKARALLGIGFYNALFELEREWVKLPPSRRLALRQERAAPLMDRLRVWRDEELGKPDIADGSPIRRALMYTRNHWEPLTRFLKDGKIPAHNNWSELELRRLVIGRANWLFVGSDESAEWTCTYVSLIASCALHKLDPEAYLGDLFRVLPSWPQTRMIELAPRYWAETRARLDPFELAMPLGPITVPSAPMALGKDRLE